jgi:hypothetical protein
MACLFYINPSSEWKVIINTIYHNSVGQDSVANRYGLYGWSEVKFYIYMCELEPVTCSLKQWNTACHLWTNQRNTRCHLRTNMHTRALCRKTFLHKPAKCKQTVKICSIAIGWSIIFLSVIFEGSISNLLQTEILASSPIKIFNFKYKCVSPSTEESR